MDKFVPKKQISGRRKIPWLTSEIKRLIKKKHRLYRKAKINDHPEDWQSFRDQRKFVQKAMKKSHMDYLNNMFEEDGNKNMWRYIKNKKSSSSGVGTLHANGQTAIDPLDKAKMLNDQFSSVFTRDGPAETPDLGPSPYPPMPEITISEAGVLALMKKIHANKASGADKIPGAFLKECAHELAPMLTAIIQKSLDEKNVPNDWKTALVSPVFKKGDRGKPENYRPISLTSICCKLSEHIIVHEMMNHLDQNNILNDRQHGFRKRRSCETQLLITTHDLAKIMNRRSQADVAVLDFSKAFDKVPHERLIQKLNHCNLHPNTVEWIRSFLTDRSQRVVVDGHTSDEKPVLSGVPQGSVLGPILFLIFINDISDSVDSFLRLFADDCLLYREIKTREDQDMLQKDLDTLVEWAKKWGMEFNIKKCNILSITCQTKKKKLYTYKMKGEKVEGIRDSLYLGVTFNSKLKWNTHIAKISSAANRMLGMLWRNLKYCPKKIKETAYKAYVRPKVEYSSSIWDPHKKKDIKKIEMVQHRGARFVTNTPHHRHSGDHTSITSIIKDLDWTSLEERRKNNRLIMLYRVTNNLVEVPQDYHPQLCPRQPARGNQKVYQRLTPNVEAFQYSFLPRTIVDWNGLNKTVAAADSLESFRRLLH